MTIKLEIFGETAGEALRELATFSAGLRNVPLPSEPEEPLNEVQRSIREGTFSVQSADAAPTRKRGEPAPGKTRRTKAEIAEDEAADAADAPDVKNGEDAMNESVGPVDDDATAEQDAADEAAEADAGRDPDAPLTGDDLKAAMALYVDKFGMEATKADGPTIFTRALGKPPAGEDYWKVSLIASMGQEQLQSAIDGWTAAAAGAARVEA